MNKLEKINYLIEKIKIYGNIGIPNIHKQLVIDLEDFEVDKEELFVTLAIDRNSIRFEIDKNGEIYIETSLNNFEFLDELTFWKTMYIVSNR